MVRHISLKKAYKQPPPILNASSVHSACQQASKTLNSVLGTHDIEIRLAESGDDKVLDNYKYDWQTSKFYWDDYIAPLNTRTQTFYMGLFKGYTLYALCESGLHVNARKKLSIDIQFIENTPYRSENPLRGYAIAAFTQANLDIAKIGNIPAIGVDDPLIETVSTYLRLGLRPSFINGFKLMKSVSNDTELNWQKLLNRRAHQGFSIPANV